MRAIGVISDTHGLLRDEALRAMEGSDLILHAGDVGDPRILEALSAIATVRAVRGNTDHGDLARRLPATDIVDLSAPDGGVATHRASATGGAAAGATAPLAYILHDLEDLDVDPAAAGMSLVVTGHTHRPVAVRSGPVLYLNPGSAGPRRFSLPISVARVEVDRATVRARIVELAIRE